MTPRATDAELVHAHLAGDAAALAAIYDRYAASLYDTAAALLGDRDEAADAVQDTFVAAAQHLGQLRDPSRLRAWLFAVTRHEVERRGRRRRRAVPTEDVADMPVSSDLDAALDARELAALVRNAARGLDERDQLVLELSLRQGLEGADLAAALGVTPAQSYSLVFRMRERVSRSLGALVVARTGRRDCAELADLLRDWDGTFSVLVRKRVARHVERCDVCERTKARASLPTLLAGAPAFAVPVGLRERVLGGSGGGGPGGGGADDLRFEPDGFPRASRRFTRGAARSRRRMVAGAAVAAVAVLAGATALLASRDSANPVEVTAGGTSPVVAEPTVSSSVAAPAPSTSTSSSTSTPSTSAPPSTTAPTIPPRPSSPPPSPPRTPGRLSLSPTAVSLGPNDRATVVSVRNTGGSSLTWSVASATRPFAATGGGTLVAGGQAPLTITVDRTGLPEGEVSGAIRLASSAGDATIALSAEVERAPVIRSVSFADRVVRAGGCAPRATTVTVLVSDESPLRVRAVVTPPGGRTTTVELAASGSGRWTGLVGPFAAAGPASVEAVAVDDRGNEAATTASLPVVACTT